MSRVQSGHNYDTHRKDQERSGTGICADLLLDTLIDLAAFCPGFSWLRSKPGYQGPGERVLCRQHHSDEEKRTKYVIWSPVKAEITGIDAHQIRSLIEELQTIAKEAGHQKPLMIGTDQECGSCCYVISAQ